MKNIQKEKHRLSFRLSSDEEILRTRIHVKLKEIMLQVDLDEVTAKFVNDKKTNKSKKRFFLSSQMKFSF